MPKYSEIRELLEIEVKKPEQRSLAFLTHYFQSADEDFAGEFKEEATRYLTSLEKFTVSELLNNPINSYLPIKWDVPFPPPQNPTFKFIDLFAGIGGFRMAFQNLGGKCVFTSEWDRFAQQTYEANYGEVPFGDITKILEDGIKIPDHDILLAGFPCQPFSIAGVSKKNSLGRNHGFLDKTQGTLFFDIARIIESNRPKVIMLENVKNLVSHDKKRTFKVIKETLEKLGYNLHYKVIDARNWVPQHRERIFIVGFNKDYFNGEEQFSFPQPEDNHLALKDILEKKVDPKYTLSDKLWDYLQAYKKKHQAKGNGFGFGLTDLSGVSRTLSARYYKDGAEILIPQGKRSNPRRLTPRECARLQGFPEEFVIPVSNNQAYKQFGNSVARPVVEAIGRKILQTMSLYHHELRETEISV